MGISQPFMDSCKTHDGFQITVKVCALDASHLAVKGLCTSPIF